MIKEKGKNYSRNNTGDRKESDFYETPYSLTRELFIADDDWNKRSKVSDNSCGNGAIVKVLEEFGFKNIYAKDLVIDGVNFLEDYTTSSYSIQNPPYSLANKFILHAKKVVTCKFAMLLPLTYLQGSQRLEHIWSDKKFPLSAIHVFNRYPMLGDPLRDDGKFRTGMQAFMWAVWNRRHNTPPVINWIDINKHVLHKGDEA